MAQGHPTGYPLRTCTAKDREVNIYYETRIFFKVIQVSVDAFVPSLVESTETFVSPLVLVASSTGIDEELRGSVDPLISSTVVEVSENRAKHNKSTELVITDNWKRYLVLYNNKNKAKYVFIINYM